MLLSLPFGVPASAALDLLGGLVCVALDCTPFGLGNGVSCVAISLPKASSTRAQMIPSAIIGLCTLNDTDLLVKTVRGSSQATACTVAKAKHANNSFRQSDLN